MVRGQEEESNLTKQQELHQPALQEYILVYTRHLGIARIQDRLDAAEWGALRQLLTHLLGQLFGLHATHGVFGVHICYASIVMHPSVDGNP